MFRVANSIITRTRAFLADEQGQDIVEYSLLLLLLGCVVLIYITGVGINVASIFNRVGMKVENVGNSIP